MDGSTNRWTEDLEKVLSWATDIRLDISPLKLSVTLLSPLTHEYHYHPQVVMDGAVIPLEKKPKILGVKLDPLFTFSPHVMEVVKSATQRL